MLKMSPFDFIMLKSILLLKGWRGVVEILFCAFVLRQAQEDRHKKDCNVTPQLLFGFVLLLVAPNVFGLPATTNIYC